MTNTWAIAGYTATIEPVTHEGRDGYDWRIAAEDGTYSKGGWEPTEAGALRACMDALARGFDFKGFGEDPPGWFGNDDQARGAGKIITPDVWGNPNGDIPF